MKSQTRRGNQRKIERESEPPDRSAQVAREETAPSEAGAGFDEDEDIDESKLEAVDDDRWDVFILDGDEPLPEYGDFWFPD